MTATAPSRAAHVASIHFGSINASRRRAGLEPLTEAQVAHEFADIDRSPVRTKAVATRTTSNTGAADGMWAAIVGKHNASVRSPIAAGRTSPAPVAVASGSIGSGALSSGSIASGAAVSGAFVAGAIADLVPAGDALCLNLGSATSVTGSISYAQF